jgi:hypothetical protein
MRAFTMMEIAVTMAIAAIVSVVAIGAYAMFLRMGRVIGIDAEVTELVRRGVLFVAEELRAVGGGGIEAWSSVIIEDDCLARDSYPACNGSDRLTLVQAVPRFPNCAIKSALTTTRIEVETVNVRGSDVCCLNESGFARQVALVWPDTMQPAVLLGVGRDCLFDIRPIVPADALPRPLATSTAATTGLPGAVIVLADVKTFYVEWEGPTRGALNMHVEMNGDGKVIGERLTILPDVADFQAALGYDVAGQPLVDVLGGGDTWWPNNSGESGRPAVGPLQPDHAVLGGVSIIAGAREVGRQDTARTPWAPPRTVADVHLRTATDRVTLET